nr:DDE-type integrase/transposase/recombinase [Wolinella succinogenes]
MDATLATEVLQEALSKYPSPKMFNSDQGSQYTSHEHTALLKNHNIETSMNGRDAPKPPKRAMSKYTLICYQSFTMTKSRLLPHTPIRYGAVISPISQ